MTTLFDIAKRVSQELGDNHYGQATGGSTTTIIDTLGLDGFPEDYFRYHGAFILEADAAAPEDEFARVIDYVPSSKTLTVDTAFSAAVAAGDRYMLTSPRYSLDDIIWAINQALHHLGPIPQQDTTLTTAASQTEVTLPSGVRDVYEVWLQGRTNDADDNEWEKQYGWRVDRAAAGSQDTLIFPYQPDPNVTIKLVHMAEHADVHDASDAIANLIDPRALTAHAVMHLIRNRLRGSNDSDPKLRQQLEQVTEEYNQRMASNPIHKPHRSPQIFTLGSRSRRITSGY